MRVALYFVVVLLAYCGEGDSQKKVEESSGAPCREGDFLTLIESANASYRGFLQGVDNSDSSGPYVYSEYFSDTLNFQLYYIPKHQPRDLITLDSVQKAKSNDYEDYKCVVFAYRMQDPDKAKNYQESGVTYPVNVRCCLRKNKNWELLKEAQVKNLKELSQFKINCIYLSN